MSKKTGDRTDIRFAGDEQACRRVAQALENAAQTAVDALDRRFGERLSVCFMQSHAQDERLKRYRRE